MSKYPLIIEKGTNYAFVIDESKNLDFDKIREYSSEFYKMLPSKMQEKLYDEILHGACELDTEPKLNAYMFALGKMHNAKLQHAYDHLSENFLKEKQIDIIDYACGQGMGTICYADFLKRKHIKQNIRRIILIEPSEKALARASLHVSAMFPDAELITINKGFDDLTSDDLFPDKNVPMLHIISNVLDMATTYNSDGFFDLEDFANLISKTIDGKNEFVCVEPFFGYAPKDEKVDDFIDYVGIETYYEIDKGKGEFVNGKDWTCVIRVGKVYKNVKKTIEKINVHKYVDLGLPSGLKWATCNVGANSPEEYGDYYAWGETETKDKYTEENSSTSGVKMNDISGNPQYDVARKKWGGNWRMPTQAEQQELIDKCTWEWIEQNGVSGYKVTGPNGCSIFLPSAGYRYGSSLRYAVSDGGFWSSVPFEYYGYGAYCLYFHSDIHAMRCYYRCHGLSVRPVLE